MFSKLAPQLVFHPDKCKLLTIGNRKLNTCYHLALEGRVYELECVNEIKDLGGTVDSNQSFESNIQIKVNKANQPDNDTFICLFKAFARPQLEYANAAWNPHEVFKIISLIKKSNAEPRSKYQVYGVSHTRDS